MLVRESWVLLKSVRDVGRTQEGIRRQRSLAVRDRSMWRRRKGLCSLVRFIVGLRVDLSGPCEVSRACPGRLALARSSPGAPHRERGLPASKPGLRAGTHDLSEASTTGAPGVNRSPSADRLVGDSFASSHPCRVRYRAVATAMVGNDIARVFDRADNRGTTHDDTQR